MCRLVEALEMYDNPHMDSYMSDEQDGSLGAGLGSIHPFGGMGLGDDMDGDDKALLGGGGGKRKVRDLQKTDTFIDVVSVDLMVTVMLVSTAIMLVLQ